MSRPLPWQPKPPHSPFRCPLSPLCACGDSQHSISTKRSFRGSHRLLPVSRLCPEGCLRQGDEAMFGRNGDKSNSKVGGNGELTAPPGQDGRELIIQAETVVKTYHTGTDEVHALKGIDFAVARGEMVAV